MSLKQLDVRGEICPYPMMKAVQALKRLKPDEAGLEVITDHAPALETIPTQAIYAFPFLTTPIVSDIGPGDDSLCTSRPIHSHRTRSSRTGRSTGHRAGSRASNGIGNHGCGSPAISGRHSVGSSSSGRSECAFPGHQQQAGGF